MAQSVSDSLLPVLARLSIAAVFIWMGTVKLFAVASGIAVLSRGDYSTLGALEPIRVVLELGGGIVLLLGSEAKRAALALLAALVIEYFATQGTGASTPWLSGQTDPSVIAIQRAVVLAGALFLAMAYDANQARGPQDNDTSFGFVALLGRWAIGGVMALTAVRDVFDFAAGARMLGDHGVPAAQVVLALDIGLRLIAGWALIIGFWTRLAALVLLALAAITYNPVLLLYRATVGDAHDAAPTHLALGLTAALLFAFLLDGAHRTARPGLRARVPASRGGH
jgi:uncharacterized membrane protein YphA (DoxX/SURF4 family)